MGMSTPPIPKVTLEEYLAAERASDTRHEYMSGQVCAMGAATGPHSTVASNLIREVGVRLKGQPCSVFAIGVRLQVPGDDACLYPDVMVICGDVACADEKHDMVVNPKVIFEVLPESTESYDRGAKWAHYRHLESLAEYVMVAQDRQHVEQFVRRPDGSWLFREHDGAKGRLRLASVRCEVALADVYYRVDLNPAA